MASFSSLKSAIFDREERKQHYQAHIRGLNAYDKHKKFLNDYVKYYGKERPADKKLYIKTDKDALREGYRYVMLLNSSCLSADWFIRTEEDDMDTAWEQRLVKRYYDKLFKEYCIADMTKYKSGKIGLRWRTEKEVISGKGQFICGNKHCDERNGLASFEVNFLLFRGRGKQASSCQTGNMCAEKLHYRRNREREQLERQQRGDKKRNSYLDSVRKAPSSDEEVDKEDNIDQSITKSEPRDKESSRRRRKAPRSDEEVDEEDNIDQSRTKSESRDNENSKRRRERSSSGDTTDEEVERSNDG
uniref:Protein FRA10AC1 n=1 Tax=Chenopodium quinoa TaxID=63459 RepID=A0A803LBZ8_CHEQI